MLHDVVSRQAVTGSPRVSRVRLDPFGSPTFVASVSSQSVTLVTAVLQYLPMYEVQPSGIRYCASQGARASQLRWTSWSGTWDVGYWAAWPHPVSSMLPNGSP